MNRGDQIAKDLRQLRSAWDDMLPEGGSVSGSARVGGSKEPPPPAPIAVLSLRREVCEVLASWCHVVIDDAVDIHGNSMVVDLDGTDAIGMAGWLMTWADFLGSHEAAADAAAEIGEAARACAVVVSGQRTRRFRVGPCIEHGTSDMGERVPCPGQLVAVLRSDEDLLPDALRCDADPAHAWGAFEWISLGRRIAAREEEAS